MMLVHGTTMAVGGLLLAVALVAPPSGAAKLGDSLDSQDDSGILRTVSSAGYIDTTNPFFQSLGTNGRRCDTCHVSSDAWSLTPETARQRFEETDGLDPLFSPNDGTDSPNADRSTRAARRRASRMLLTKGLIRVERPMPDGAEFTLVAVDDPYHYAGPAGLSLFRRPLPSTNLRFISTVMWDGREVDPATPMLIENTPEQNEQILRTSLAHQALDATLGHAQASDPPTQAQLDAIVDFELGLATAQAKDNGAGWLSGHGGMGGPELILDLPFYIGINDNVNDPAGPFDPIAMTMYAAWQASHDDDRKAIARGEQLFNTKPIIISGVKGLNDNPYFGKPDSLVGTCTTCHNTPNVANHSFAIALDIGTSDGSRRTSDMPLYTLRNKKSGVTLQTTDPGLALSTGKWADIGRFKGPILRGLAARAPYFHNGSARNLREVVRFYEQRFGLQLSNREERDLIAFLRSL